MITLLMIALPAAVGAAAPRLGDLLVAGTIGSGGEILAVDPSSGVSSVVCSTIGIALIDVAVSPGGSIYALGRHHLQQRTVILAINPSTGITIPVFEFESLSSTLHLTAGPGEQIYIAEADPGRLLSISAETGTATVVGDIEVSAIAIDGDGIVWAIQPGSGAPILGIAPDGGIVSRIFPNIQFTASAITVDTRGFIHVMGKVVNRAVVITVHPASPVPSEQCSPTTFVDVLNLTADASGIVFLLGLNNRILRGEIHHCDGRTLVWSAGQLYRPQGIAIFDPIELRVPVLRETWGRIKARYR